MWSELGAVVGPLALGAVGWFGTNFVAKPLVALYDLRGKVHEELFMTSNVGGRGTDPERYNEAQKALRRLAAQVSALEATWPEWLRWYLDRFRFDLPKASTGLTGLSNTLHDEQGSKVLHRTDVENGLRLPQFYPKELVEAVRRAFGRQDKPVEREGTV